MKIKDKLIDPFEIHVEDNQYILRERKIRGKESKKVGEVYFNDMGYYNTPDYLMQALSHMLIARQTHETDLSGFLQAFKDIRLEIRELLGALK